MTHTTTSLRLSPVAIAAATLCRGYIVPRASLSGWVYVGAGGPFGAHRMARPSANSYTAGG